MHRNVETLIGRLATDSGLRQRFADNPQAVLCTLVEQGIELTPVELEALAVTDPRALDTFAQTLDRRLRKAPPAAETLNPTRNQEPLS